LADVIKRLPDILTRLATMYEEGDDVAADDRSRPRQVENFRSRFASRITPEV
jgi:hypothetical protein